MTSMWSLISVCWAWTASHQSSDSSDKSMFHHCNSAACFDHLKCCSRYHWASYFHVLHAYAVLKVLIAKLKFLLLLHFSKSPNINFNAFNWYTVLRECSVILSKMWTPTWVFSSLLGVCWYCHADILIWILIMCWGGKIHQSFKDYLQTLEA